MASPLRTCDVKCVNLNSDSSESDDFISYVSRSFLQIVKILEHVINDNKVRIIVTETLEQKKAKNGCLRKAIKRSCKGEQNVCFPGETMAAPEKRFEMTEVLANIEMTRRQIQLHSILSLSFVPPLKITPLEFVVVLVVVVFMALR